VARAVGAERGAAAAAGDLQLGGLAVLISVVVAIPLGVLAAVNKGTALDAGANVIALLGQSLPTFWLGIILIWVFAVGLGWLPTSGYGGIRHMILPAVAMAWFQIAALTRLTRSAMLEVLDAEYIKLAGSRACRSGRSSGSTRSGTPPSCP
jgi:peptide/nickel transport system permease protein